MRLVASGKCTRKFKSLRGTTYQKGLYCIYKCGTYSKNVINAVLFEVLTKTQVFDAKNITTIAYSKFYPIWRNKLKLYGCFLSFSFK